jgi:hypothetical protein
MALQKALVRAGIGIQASKGTALTNPVFAHGITGGSPFGIDITQDRAPLTSATRVAVGVDRTGAVAKFDLKFRATPKAIGAWLYLALMSKSVTGAGPYTHTITQGNTPVYGTVFGVLDTGEIRSLQDCIVDSLEISWSGAGPVEVAVSGMGTIPSFAPTFTPTNDESFATYMTAPGATPTAANFKFAASGAAALAAISAGNVKITNNAGAIELSYSIVPDEIYLGRQDYEAGFTLVPGANLNDWRTVVTGSGGGSTISQVPVYGAFDVTVGNGTDSLKLAATRVPYLVDYPEGDPNGGNVTLDFAGMPVLTAAGAAALTATLINSQATY